MSYDDPNYTFRMDNKLGNTKGPKDIRPHEFDVALMEFKSRLEYCVQSEGRRLIKAAEDYNSFVHEQYAALCNP